MNESERELRKCPLTDFPRVKCFEGNCAWWNRDVKKCAVLHISISMVALVVGAPADGIPVEEKR